MAEITVNSFSGLKSAIQDNVSTMIHLGADITFSSGGISVPRSKGDIVIDGHGFKVTDYNSVNIGDTINFGTIAGPAVTVTLQDVIWNGSNYYGVIGVSDNSNNSNITLIINNVQYTGRQMIYNRNGITRIIDSTISLEEISSRTPQEFCEANRLSIEGTVIVNSQAASDAVIWFLHSGSVFTVEKNAVFKVTAPNTYMFYTDTQPDMLFKENSVTEINTKDGLYFGTGATSHIANSFTIEKNASFKATHSNRRAVPTFKCRNSVVIGEGSTFHLTAPVSGSAPLMYFGNVSALSFNNPKSVILYNNGGNVFSFAAAGTSTSRNAINIIAELLNRWSKATTPYSSAGGFADVPTATFAKANGSNVEVTANASSTAVVNITSNLAPGDTGYPMSSTNFDVFQTQVLSMGNININLNEITDASTAITGTTEPLANLKAVYNAATLTGASALDGQINLAITTPIPVDSDVLFGVNWNFLTKYITQLSAGSVRITYLPDLPFMCFVVPYRNSIVKRKNASWYMEITDTRTSGDAWYLYASLPDPMRSEHDDTLDDVLTINEATTSEIVSVTPVLIKRGSWSEPGAITRIEWPELEGFLLRVNPDALYNKGHYTADIKWELGCTPLD